MVFWFFFFFFLVFLFFFGGGERGGGNFFLKFFNLFFFFFVPPFVQHCKGGLFGLIRKIEHDKSSHSFFPTNPRSQFSLEKKGIVSDRRLKKRRHRLAPALRRAPGTCNCDHATLSAENGERHDQPRHLCCKSAPRTFARERIASEFCQSQLKKMTTTL